MFYYQLMEVTDFRNDVILAEACRQDVEKYCKDVEPGRCGLHRRRRDLQGGRAIGVLASCDHAQALWHTTNSITGDRTQHDVHLVGWSVHVPAPYCVCMHLLVGLALHMIQS